MKTNFSFRVFCFLAAFAACVNAANAQLPNEKFGKPSSLEWDYMGWGDATSADAIILAKTMTVTYQLSDQVATYNESFSDLGADNITDFSKNVIDESNILVRYKVALRTKILKPEGSRHANIDITYFDADNGNTIFRDELTDMKVTVFSKNEKGKVVKRKVNTSNFQRERVDANYMVIHVEVPDAGPGSIVEYQYDITSTRPTFLYDWVFQESIPTVRSKCDIDIPAFLQFNMNAPINKLIKSNVEVGRLAYDTNRSDLKRGKSIPTNHYTITGDYILPEGQTLKHNQHNSDEKPKAAAEEEIAPFTSRINMSGVTPPPALPKGSTHLRVL